MLILFTVGLVLEAGGLVTAVWGLRQTWHENAEGRPFLPTWLTGRMLRQTKTLPLRYSVAAGLEAEGKITAEGRVGNATPEQRLDALERQGEESRRRLIAAEERAEQLAAEVKQLRQHADDAANRAEEAAISFARLLSIGGVRLAAFGLVLVASGLILQSIASIATWNG